MNPMPIYDYKCNICDYEFEKIKRMDDRKVPETESCPHCDGDGCIEQSILHTSLSVSYVYEHRSTLNKLNNASAFKEKLQQIHESTPGSVLNKSSSFVEVK